MFLTVQGATQKRSKSPSSTLSTAKSSSTATKPTEQAKQQHQKPAESKPTTQIENETKQARSDGKGSSDTPDPSPLKPARRPGGESPPKVFKRKAPAPQSQDDKPASNSETALARTIPPEPSKPAEQSPPVLAQRQDARQSKGPHTDDHKPSAPVIPKLELTSHVNSNNTAMTSSSSTEQLIPESSPEALRPVKRIEDVNTIKRQPKAGWL